MRADERTALPTTTAAQHATPCKQDTDGGSRANGQDLGQDAPPMVDEVPPPNADCRPHDTPVDAGLAIGQASSACFTSEPERAFSTDSRKRAVGWLLDLQARTAVCVPPQTQRATPNDDPPVT